MKQRISYENIDKLSKVGKDKLNEWWNPEPGDIYLSYTNRVPRFETVQASREIIHSICIDIKTDYLVENRFISYEKDTPDLIKQTGAYEFKKTNNIYPLLSLGQMICYLSSKKPYSWTAYVKDHGNATELCDNLWSAVKEDLNGKTS